MLRQKESLTLQTVGRVTLSTEPLPILSKLHFYLSE